ncbi:acyltransferase [Methanobrevibacter smithii]|uniref:acyltransferase n=1 Tax=Methanobrevibacter smithii TaxID=2173 RepID=UPI0037DC156B
MSEENVTEFESQLKEKDQKLDNQSSELNYLTNEIIPNLKKENAELKKIKNELTEALEKTTRKYYDQLDINADLSEKLTKIGAEDAINKVRAEKLESEIDDIKKDAEAKVADFKAKLDDVDADKVDKIKAENQDLHSQLTEKTSELDKLKELVPDFKSEIDDLRKQVIEMGNYKEEVDAKVKGEMNKLNEEIKSLTAELKGKQSSYDKLYNDSQKTIDDLKGQVSKLKKTLEKQANRGFLDRLSNKKVSIDDD